MSDVAVVEEPVVVDSPIVEEVQDEVAVIPEVIPEVAYSDLEAEHYHEIMENTKQVRKACTTWEIARDNAAEKKKDYDKLNKKLFVLISRGPSDQRMLPLADAQKDSSGSTSSELGEPQVDESWKNDSLDVLFSGAILKAFQNAGIKTVGELASYTAEKALTDLDGIGEKKAEEIENKMEDYWAKKSSEILEEGVVEEAEEDAGELAEDEAELEPEYLDEDEEYEYEDEDEEESDEEYEDLEVI